MKEENRLIAIPTHKRFENNHKEAHIQLQQGSGRKQGGQKGGEIPKA